MSHSLDTPIEFVESTEWQEIEETLQSIESPPSLATPSTQIAIPQTQVSPSFDNPISSMKFPFYSSSTSSSFVPITLEAELQTRDEFAVRIQPTVTQPLNGRFVSHSLPVSPPISDSNILTLFTTHFPSARFDINRNLWLFPVSEHNRLKNILQTLPYVHFTPLPDWILRIFNSSSSASSKHFPLNNFDFMSSPLLNALLPFQREGLEYALRRGGRVLFADEMGLGKTLQALATILYWRHEWPVLIVVPSSLRLQWADQVQQWIPNIVPTDINIIMNSKCNVNGLINIISYDLVPKLFDKIKTKNFKIVIADESHFLKNNRTKRTQAVLPLLKSARRAILLTGTPAVSRPVELFPQLQSLRPDLFRSFIPFGLRYCNGHRDRFGWNFHGASHLRELYVLLNETVMIRRLKKNVLTQLPPKRRQKVCISISSKCKTLINKINRELKEIRCELRNENLSESEARDLRFNRRRVLLELYHDTGTAKLLSVTEYLKDLLESGEKFLVFAHHQDVLDGLCHALYQLNVDHVRIDGHTPGALRHDLVTHFQTHDACKVAVLSMTAAGVGLTFTKASTVIFAELFWNPGTLCQCEDRAHRIGQQNSVNVHYLVAVGTIDEMIWDLLQHKLEVLGETLNGQGVGEESLNIAAKVRPDLCPEEIDTDPFLNLLLEKMMTYDSRRERALRRKQLRKNAIENENENEHKNKNECERESESEKETEDGVYQEEEEEEEEDSDVSILHDQRQQLPHSYRPLKRPRQTTKEESYLPPHSEKIETVKENRIHTSEFKTSEDNDIFLQRVSKKLKTFAYQQKNDTLNNDSQSSTTSPMVFCKIIDSLDSLHNNNKEKSDKNEKELLQQHQQQQLPPRSGDGKDKLKKFLYHALETDS